MTQLEVLTDEKLTVATKASTALGIAQALKIETDNDRLRAGEFVKMVKALVKEVKADREPERIAAQKLLDAIRGGRNKHLVPLEQAEVIVKGKALAYDEKKELERKQEQERINAANWEEEQTRILAEAQILEEAGATEAAAELRAQEPEVVPVIIPNLAPKIEGQHTTCRWKCRELNFETLVKAAAKNHIARTCLQFNQVAANQQLAIIKGKLSEQAIASIAELPDGTVLTAEQIGTEIPGLEIYTEKGLASKSW